MNRKVYLIFSVMVLVSACHPFKSEVRALLTESGAVYKITNIAGGWRERKMYCDLQINPAEIKKLIDYLDLDKPLPGKTDLNHFLYLSKGQELGNLKIEELINFAFGYPLWVPSRHGFGGAFLIYDPENEQGRLWLSIAYG